MKGARLATPVWRVAASRRRRAIRCAIATLLASVLLIVGLLAWWHAIPLTAHTTSTEPPWVYGNPHARYTLVEYADLECPYCKAYFPVLKPWIDAQPDVNWTWHHRPLAMHEPAASREARLAECAGRTSGSAAFWRAVAWIYATTRSNGDGVPTSAVFPWSTARQAACLADPAVAEAIDAQSRAADRDGITATPTITLTDRRTGKSIRLEGAVEGDDLLSALDWLAASSVAPANAPRRPP